MMIRYEIGGDAAWRVVLLWGVTGLESMLSSEIKKD